jgi:hypothetical protein
LAPCARVVAGISSAAAVAEKINSDIVFMVFSQKVVSGLN